MSEQAQKTSAAVEELRGHFSWTPNIASALKEAVNCLEGNFEIDSVADASEALSTLQGAMRTLENAKDQLDQTIADIEGIVDDAEEEG
jgi:hypothetical protein